MHIKSIKEKWTLFPSNIKAAIWMILSCVFFAILTLQVRYLSNDYSLFQIIFFRSFFGIIFVIPWIYKDGIKTIKTTSYGLQALRAILACMAMYFWFYSISSLPLAEAIAINYIAPIFAIILAIIILKERIRIRRIIAVILSLIGMLVIIRPGIIEVSEATLAAILASFLMASGATIVKILTSRDHPNSVVFIMPLTLSFISIIPAMFFWKNTNLFDFILLSSTGLAATLAHQGMTRAFAIADSSYVLAFDYLRLPIIAIIGYIVFSEKPSIWVWIGSLIILLSSLYIMKREKINKAFDPPSIISSKRIP